MTERTVTQHPVERGPVASLFSGTLKFIFFLVIALVFSILVEWIGLTFFWADEGQQHSAQMLTQESNTSTKILPAVCSLNSPRSSQHTPQTFFTTSCFEKVALNAVYSGWRARAMNPAACACGYAKPTILSQIMPSLQ